MLWLFFLLLRLPPGYTRTDTHVPYTTLFRAQGPGEAPDPPAARREDRPRHREALREADAGTGRPDGGRPFQQQPPRAARRPALRPQPPSADVRGQDAAHGRALRRRPRSEEHTSELQSLMRNSYAVFCLKKKKRTQR